MPVPRHVNAREKILEAAEQFVLEQGAAHLTLDAIAKAAHISKGGLLYHFRSKDALIRGLIERVHRGWMDALSVARTHEKTGPGHAARVLHRDAFDPSLHLEHASMCERHQRIVAALSAAIAHRPDLLKPVRETYRAMLTEFEKDSLPLGKSLLMMCAYDALWWSGVFGTYELSAKQIEALQKELSSLLYPTSKSRKRKSK